MSVTSRSGLLSSVEVQFEPCGVGSAAFYRGPALDDLDRHEIRRRRLAEPAVPPVQRRWVNAAARRELAHCHAAACLIGDQGSPLRLGCFRHARRWWRRRGPCPDGLPGACSSTEARGPWAGALGLGMQNVTHVPGCTPAASPTLRWASRDGYGRLFGADCASLRQSQCGRPEQTASSSARTTRIRPPMWI